MVGTLEIVRAEVLSVLNCGSVNIHDLTLAVNRSPEEKASSKHVPPDYIFQTLKWLVEINRLWVVLDGKCEPGVW